MGFSETILPHLDAAYNLARWLTRNPDDAEDVVQEALVRAMKHFGGYRGGSSKAWFLTIVRNSSFSWLERRKNNIEPLPEQDLPDRPGESSNPEASAVRGSNRQRVHEAIRSLPIEYREVVILRELEGASYKEISAVVGVPIGTVMSRLSRARQQLQESLSELRNFL